MRLKQGTVQRFRNIVEPQTFEVEGDVTSLVGKTESGKTTVLKALHRLNPANQVDISFDLTTEYPRWRLAPDRRRDSNLASITPIAAIFELTDDDRAALAEIMPIPLPKETTCTASRVYDGTQYVSARASLQAIFRCVADAADLTSDDLKPLLKAESITAGANQARAAAKVLKDEADTALRSKP